MPSKTETIKKEVKNLIVKGNHLYLAMIEDVSGLPDEIQKQLKDNKIKLPTFVNEYDSWYSEALVLIKQLLPDRLEDFKRQYKDEKRKEISFLTYGISDYLYGLRTTRGWQEDVVADKTAAVGKMQVQNSILVAVEKRLDSSLFDIQEILQADLFDSELDVAQELAKKGFVRGGGAIAGVVLEKHLGHVCEIHGLKTRKKHPSISDFYQMLKENDIIDTPKWRFIQHLGDLRNLCDHNKDREPTKEDVLELVEGVQKVIKTVF
ncbi:hypothetical protein HNO51_05530 [Billgrantia sulfidoxydans]|uniref:DUF4145 domain-containing protein n=1 Tax=Billgrantia sulfidoxydans TaxID=2733484 RepID=A0ABX7W3G9_9GAMM|nr:hypothetical protein [Halomonas sulfidoxydans]QTP54192.1 hypothetical protein HNO51_05530 [Halomonas sulfidoxydans]